MAASTHGNRLRGIRKQKGLSGHKVAEELGVTPGSYYKYERGEQSLNVEMLERLAKIFNVSVDYILGLTDEPGGYFEQKEFNVKKLLEDDFKRFHWNGIPLDEEQLKAAKEVIEYMVWKKIQGKDD